MLSCYINSIDNFYSAKHFCTESRIRIDLKSSTRGAVRAVFNHKHQVYKQTCFRRECPPLTTTEVQDIIIPIRLAAQNNLLPNYMRRSIEELQFLNQDPPAESLSILQKSDREEELLDLERTRKNHRVLIPTYHISTLSNIGKKFVFCTMDGVNL